MAYPNAESTPVAPLNPCVGEQNGTKHVSSPNSPLPKEAPTSPNGTSSTANQHTLRVRARETIAETKKPMKRIHQLLKSEQTTMASRTALVAQRGFGDTSKPFMPAAVGQYAVQKYMHPLA